MQIQETIAIYNQLSQQKKSKVIQKIYQIAPTPVTLTPQDVPRVLGGEMKPRLFSNDRKTILDYIKSLRSQSLRSILQGKKSDYQEYVSKISQYLTMPQVGKIQMLSTLSNRASDTNLSKIQALHIDKKIKNVTEFCEKLKMMKGLKTLNVEDNRIGAEGIKKLVEALPHLKHLERIYVGNNKIGAEGIKKLAEALPHLKNLQKLDVSGNHIGDVGIKKLAEALPHLKHLDTLYVSGNHIGEEGATTLAEALPHLKHLETLRINRNLIGDNGLRSIALALRDVEKPLTIYLSNNNISKNTLSFVRWLLTDYKITFDS